jgi:glycyl-radical enzyme activating protein
MKTEGIITDIHRTSVVDGPGIRTTVFLKGCPLSCIWCHNPETIRPEPQLGFKSSRCIGCGECIAACPQSALSMQDDKATVNWQRCINCLACVDICPSEALFTYGRKVSVEDIMRDIIKDRIYYTESGGGVTISGGEPMRQPAFTIALLAACKREGIHTCLDTCGIGSLSDFKKTLPLVDLYLFDYKASDPQLHKTLTGGSLQAVLRTLHLLLDANAQIRLRCPLIPGVNDDDAHIREIARLSHDYQTLEGVELLPWHTMGMAKYATLGSRVSKRLPESNTHEERKDHYRNLLAEAGATKVTVIT